MRATILFFAVLRERAGCEELELTDLPAGLDVAGLKRELAARRPELGPLEHVRGVLGTAYVPDDTPVPDGARVALIPPVSGGSGAAEGTSADTDAALERGVFELSAEPLDPAACQRRVSHPSCGAVALFTGQTRSRNRGRDVVRLSYEAYEAMTGPEMARIFARCRAGHSDAASDDPEHRLRMLCQHRVGTVEIGEPSVVVAVASPHRDAAFGACRFLIDELKRSLPVWKKELYPDGEHWIGEGA